MTWLTVGMHVVKEFVRFKWRRDECAKSEKTQFISNGCDENRVGLEESNGCEIQPT